MLVTDRLIVLGSILEQGVVPVFCDQDVEVCINVIQSCVDAGAACVEFTNREHFSPAVFLEVSRHFSQSRSPVMLGVGSVVDAPTAALYIANGASFVVGPLLNPEVARLCNRRGIAYMPGCATASEIGMAQELGCELIKLFPGGATGGPDFVKSILAPMPWTRLMPTGGVEPTPASLREWFGAGIAACGIGSRMLTKQMLQDKDYSGIQSSVRRVLDEVRAIRLE